MKHALVGLCLVTLAGCSKKPSQDDCDKLLDHVVELEMAAAGTSATTAEARADLEAQKKKVTGYVGKDFIDSCLKELPLSQLQCGLSAKSLEELARCDES